MEDVIVVDPKVDLSKTLKMFDPESYKHKKGCMFENDYMPMLTPKDVSKSCPECGGAKLV